MRTLTAIGLKNAPDGKLFDGGGLMLNKKGATGRWLYRYSHLGKRREMGLGSWPVVSLADARKARDGWAAILAAGKDPIGERNRQRDAEIANRDRSDPTFAQMVDIVFEAKQATLRGGGTRGRWRSPIDHYMIPAIGRKRMSDIHQSDIKDALAPIWKTKHPTAQKAFQRTRIVFREARLMGFDCDPFTVEAAQRMLGDHRHVPTHIAATPWQEAPETWGALSSPLASARCLRWIMLTLVRADAARGARVSEVEGNVWTVPADRVKGREGLVKDFRVPLSAPAMAMVEECRALGLDLMFPGKRGVSPITDRALEKHLDGLGIEGRPHGFRTSFRMWVQDTDACPFDVAETVLGHSIGGKVERTYARSDLLERRRPVMDAWAGFLRGVEDNVVKIRR